MGFTWQTKTKLLFYSCSRAANGLAKPIFLDTWTAWVLRWSRRSWAESQPCLRQSRQAARWWSWPTRTCVDEAKNSLLWHLPQSWRGAKLPVRGDAAEEQSFDVPRPSRPLHASHRRRHAAGQLCHRNFEVWPWLCVEKCTKLLKWKYCNDTSRKRMIASVIMTRLLQNSRKAEISAVLGWHGRYIVVGSILAFLNNANMCVLGDMNWGIKYGDMQTGVITIS